MKLNAILNGSSTKLREISLNCQQFIEESNDRPLIKWCSNSYDDVHRVKIRKRNKKTHISTIFNKAFYDIYPSLLQRSIIINNEKTNAQDAFYVFPSNGYKFLYSHNITNAEVQYNETYDDVSQKLSCNATDDILHDIIQYSYVSDSLENAILSFSEIIIYNIPFFYVVRANIDYPELLDYLTR